MVTNLNYRTRLGAMITSSLLVSVVAALTALVLTALGAQTVAAVVATLALLVVAGCAVIAAASVGETGARVDEVVAAADELTTNRLPQLSSGVLGNEALDGFEPFPGASDEGLGRVITALNTVQSETRDLALQQRTLVREGVSNLVVNLVRRNQGLLERQLDHIDRLESSEEDPDRLEDLYGVDHLASRMRRNAESLLVLAGLDPQRRKGDPISINDLMRVAMGEIEGYQNVRITSVDDGQVSAQSALDIAHLLSELLENATQFSPPTATVELAGATQSDGSFLISIADNGIGMSPEQIADYNALLANPPELTLELGRSLGLLVVARLAQRLGLTVELAHATSGAGVMALVLVPQPLMNGQQPTPRTSPAPAADPAAGAPAAPPAATPAAPPAVTPPAVTPAAPPAAPPAVTPAAASTAPPAVSPAEPVADWSPPETATLSSLAPPTPPPPAPPAQPSPVAETTPAPSPPTPDGPTSRPGGDRPQPAQSEALAKLLGVPMPESEPAPPSNGDGTAPQRLEEAIPSGDDFDAGVAGLLSDPGQDHSAPLTGEQPGAAPPDDGVIPGMPPQRTSKGLAKRDRSKSRAPIGEGRVIPDTGNAAAASSRDPQEIRDMLARYRKAREGTTPDGAPETGDVQ